jgi:hypothetical protein
MHADSLRSSSVRRARLVASVRRARSFKSVATGAVALGVVVLSVMFALYLRYVHYKRVASFHLPAGTALAVRVDVEQAIFYEPIRRHILPLFGGPGSSPSEADARLSRMEVRSRLKRGDLREIVVGRGVAPGDWVVVLGGIFPPTDSDRLVTALSDEPGWASVDEGRRAEHRTTGVTVSRATDGAVVIASSSGVLAASLPPSAAYEKVGLPPSGAGGFALSHAALAELAKWPHVLAAGDLPFDLEQLDSVTGQFTPGERIGLVATFRAGPGRPAKRAAEGALELLRTRSRAGAVRENVLLRGAVDRAAIRDTPSGAELSSGLERPEVDYALASVADAIRAHW